MTDIGCREGEKENSGKRRPDRAKLTLAIKRMRLIENEERSCGNESGGVKGVGETGDDDGRDRGHLPHVFCV